MSKIRALPNVSIEFDGDDTDEYLKSYLEHLELNDCSEDEIKLEQETLEEIGYTERFGNFSYDLKQFELEDLLSLIEEYLYDLENDEGWVLTDNGGSNWYGLGVGQVISGYLGYCTELSDFHVKGVDNNNNFKFVVEDNVLTIGYSHHDGYSAYYFKNLGYMTKDELSKLAKDNSLRYPSNIRKSVLIDYLKEDMYQY